ncbi:MAG: sensor histidine kinase [Haliscomenobacteraceae bacterium CHB4]|nr:Adaptive-response sensory-kinase SasA [Saprospiraceae bacterium]MCE7925454.1 sensor histidine kinase [Haliscomenobacteraceae bacterium CHB4]
MLIEKIPLRRFSRFVIGYMVLAFAWWTYSLWQQNDRIYELEKQALETRFTRGNKGVNLTQLYETAEYKKIERNWHKGHRMVIAEGLFFTACLIFGLWVINRSANREVTLARQRRNFLLSITHELKSPIASVRLVLETLSRRELSREQIEKLCKSGLKDANRLQQLVEDLLLAARLEDNWRPLREPVDLPALARDVVSGLHVRFPEANIQLRFPNNFPPVQADKSGLTAIVQNLLENAVKYSPEGALIELSAEHKDGAFRLRVTDEGRGIPDAEKQAVFEKFYRLGNEETRQATGTGLGLYIVNQVVKAHSGTLRVEDNKPQGTVFEIEM